MTKSTLFIVLFLFIISEHSSFLIKTHFRSDSFSVLSIFCRSFKGLNIIKETTKKKMALQCFGKDQEENGVEEDKDDEAFQIMKNEIDMIINDYTGEETGKEVKEMKTIDERILGVQRDSPVLKRTIAISSILLGSLFHFAQPSQSINPVALLHTMEKESIGLADAVCNGKPTVIEFYADWCESCKELAPTMRAMELKYRNDMNFLTVNGVNPQNAPLVSAFGVDGIPHTSFVDQDSQVLTALVGAVPPKIMENQLKALRSHKPLPYDGLDAFATQDSHFLVDKTKDNNVCVANSLGSN